MAVVIASVHVADVGVRRGATVVRKAPKPGSIHGLRHADVGFGAPLSKSVLPKPTLSRVGLIAFWDDDDAVDRFLAEHPLAATLSGGWHVRLEPLRAFGAWPGLPAGVSGARKVDYDGPAVVLTLGRFRLTQAVRFFRTSAKAEGGVVNAPGLIWATGVGRPPFVCTCSLWENARSLTTYAYGNREPVHPNAIAVDQAKPFHHQSAFIRFRPYGARGGLEGKNPLVEHALL
jgi:hypothetical protein